MDLNDLFQQAEGDRRSAGMVRFGTVAEVDYGGVAQQKPARARVKLADGLVTGWLPWLAGAAGTLRIWNPLEIGEQVAVLSPSGASEQGLIVAGLNQIARAAPSDNPFVTHVEWSDSTRLAYDRLYHRLEIELTDPEEPDKTLTLAFARSEGEIKASARLYLEATDRHGGNTVTLELNSDGTLGIKAPGGVKLDGDVEVTGALKIGGAVEVTEGVVTGGDVTVGGALTVAGGISAEGGLSSGGADLADLANHVHVIGNDGEGHDIFSGLPTTADPLAGIV